VLTIMTTNNLKNIPPELYRTGRVDMVMKIPRMSAMEANNFAQEVFTSVVGKKATLKQVQALSNALKLTALDDFAHAEVAELVYTTIKVHEWVAL
jgi:SpoVK/Ycf46/Vps4 family AAA+-type ATPase